MNHGASIVFVWACLIASAAFAGEKHETRIRIISDDAGDGVFEWQSSDPNQDLSELQVGESRILTGDDGKTVTVTRTEGGFEFDTGGKKVEVMEFMGDGNVTVDVDIMRDGDGTHLAQKILEDDDVVIEKSRSVRIVRADDAADVTIISSDAIDENTRARIRAVLQDAGKDGEILFIDGTEPGGTAQAHGEHDVRIIRKKVEKTN